MGYLKNAKFHVGSHQFFVASGNEICNVLHGLLINFKSDCQSGTFDMVRIFYQISKLQYLEGHMPLLEVKKLYFFCYFFLVNFCYGGDLKFLIRQGSTHIRLGQPESI